MSEQKLKILRVKMVLSSKEALEELCLSGDLVEYLKKEVIPVERLKDLKRRAYHFINGAYLKNIKTKVCCDDDGSIRYDTVIFHAAHCNCHFNNRKIYAEYSNSVRISDNTKFELEELQEKGRTLDKLKELEGKLVYLVAKTDWLKSMLTIKTFGEALYAEKDKVLKC